MLLGIDVGTSGLKVGLFGVDGRLLAQAGGRYPLRCSEPGAAEQDPGAWWRTLGEATRQVLAGQDRDRRQAVAEADDDHEAALGRATAATISTSGGTMAQPLRCTQMRLTYTARDFDRTVAFYRDSLGFRLVSQWDRADSRGAILDSGLGGGETGLVEILGAPAGQRYEGPAPAGCVLMLEVEDVDALHAQLRAAGADPAAPEDRPWGRVFRVVDPEGLAVDVFRRRT